MLELIFQGLLEWLYGLILEVWEYFFSAFLDVLSVDFDYLKIHIPVIPDIMRAMLAAGWALLLGNLVFQAMKSMMTGLGFEGEDPKLLFTRTFVFAFLLVASPQICQIGLDLTARVIDLLGGVDAADVELVGETTFAGLGASWLLIIIVNVVLMFKTLRFLLEIVERYLVLAFLTICAPLAFGVGGSKNTADIFTGWCRMFASMCFMMVSNMICFKLLLSLLGNPPVGTGILLWIALVFGVLKLARKVDAIITRIGLNPAITGDGLGGRSLPGILAYTVMRTMVGNAVRTAGKATGKTGGTAQSKETNTNGGKPNYKNPAASGAGMSSRSKNAGTGANGAQRTTAAQSGAAQSGGQQRPAGQPVTVVPDASEIAAMDGASPAPNVSAAAQQRGEPTKGQERRSSVPPGAVRSPSVVKQGGAVSNTAKSTNTSRNTSSVRSEASATVKGGGSTPHPGAAGKSGVTGMRTAAANGKVPQPGSAGIGAGSPQRNALDSGARLQRGTAGTTPGMSGNNAYANGTTEHHGTAGTTGMQTSVHNAPRTMQSHSSQSSVQASHQNAGTSAIDAAKPVGGALSQDSELRSTRFSQRPASAKGGVVRVVSSKAAAGATEPKPAATSGAAPHSAAPAPTASRSSTAQQESRAPRPSNVGVESARKAPAPAQQEPRPARPSAAGSGSVNKPSVSAPARQESRAARPSSAKLDAARKSSTHATAQQEGKPRAKNRFSDKRARPRLGAAEIAPPAARNTHADKTERPPRQEKTPEEPVLNAEAVENIPDDMKEGDASE